MKAVTSLSVLIASAAISSAVMAEPVPSYDENSGELFIPMVDAAGMPGHFQDIGLEPAGDNQWKLTNIKEGVLLDVIESVEVVQTSNTPAQVLLRVEGTFPTGCGGFGYVREKLAENHYEVRAYYLNDTWLESPEVVLCTQATRPFTKYLPLSVYGQPAGEYTYTLNEEFSGTFTLESDNVMADSAPAQ
ncbi:hypothetical protein GCM10011403_12540 [Pseudohongiella nitratireducens]|uniref:Secreted protein n=1 Tax=Pseudohongiella nitratireducens TaxID=1768907 RepID=A0A917LUX7_9GAMM|nr:hypothetical protein [Pseudohongiella nitratireducens]GGG56873.1 hypothetical protein GCM10011403_12540 [Pseudohongiella nitratireducens]